MANPYTGDKTRIILSFANADGCELFVHWLRDRLMKDLDYYSENAVFLDNVASRDGGKIEAYSPTGATFDTKTDDITTSDGSYLSIGARNDNWLKMWETALSQAKVLIQIQTPPYFTSDACAKEMSRIGEKLGKGDKLEVLAITLDGSMAQVIINGVGHTTAMKLSKVPGTSLPSFGDNQSPVKLLKDSWVISESDFKRVSDFVKANGCRVGA